MACPGRRGKTAVLGCAYEGEHLRIVVQISPPVFISYQPVNDRGLGIMVLKLLHL